MTYSIRTAELTHMQAIGRLYTESWLRTYRGLVPDAVLDAMSEVASAEKWSEYLGRPEHVVLVAEVNGRLAGFAGCRPCGESGEGYLLDSLHVAPEFSGRGIGRALIGCSAQAALDAGYKRLVVHVVKGNGRAECLYRGLGARQLSEFVDPTDGALCRVLVWEDPGQLIGLR